MVHEGQAIMDDTVGLPGDFLFDLAASEDIIVDTAPDVLREKI